LLARRRGALVAALGLVVSGGAMAAPPEDGARAVDARVVARGLYTTALLSPVGEKLLVSDDNYAGLSVIDVKSGHMRMLTAAARAGFRAVWVDDTHVAHRNPARPFDGDPLLMLDLDGVFTFFVFLRTSDEGHVTLASDVVIVDLRMAGPVIRPLAKTPQLERAPSLSHDGAMISWIVDDTVVVARLDLTPLTRRR
jgi:hypothetical protein